MLGAKIEKVDVSVYNIPTETPESDGTLAWDKTTLVLVEAWSQGVRGIGYTYADTGTGALIRDKLADVVTGRPVMDTPSSWLEMVKAIRNLGRPGISSMAISAVDTALWDLKARLLGLPLVQLLGAAHQGVEAYGSGGFTSYSIDKLQEQLSRWVAQGLRAVKMKVGTHPDDDFSRVRAARMAIGTEPDLFVDANGAYSRKQALTMADHFYMVSVSWFEEPVSSDDLEGLRLLRDRAPAEVRIAAGEYGYDLHYFRRMLDAGAVDVLQADATRCGGVTGFLQVADLCLARGIQLSAHCAPALHATLACAALPSCNIEYFFDHVRIEQRLFEGAPVPVEGKLAPDLSKPGLGLELRRDEAQRFAA